MASTLASVVTILFPLLASIASTIVLSYVIFFGSWETVRYALSEEIEIVDKVFDSKVLVVNMTGRRVFLVPATARLWSICLDLSGMNNLIISCASTCIIILFSCLIIFPIGLIEKQVPSIFIVSVLYTLSGIFAIFSLGIWELSRGDCGGSLLGSRLYSPSTNLPCSAGTYERGNAFYVGWTGVISCFISGSSVYFLSKAMRGKFIATMFPE